MLRRTGVPATGGLVSHHRASLVTIVGCVLLLALLIPPAIAGAAVSHPIQLPIWNGTSWSGIADAINPESKGHIGRHLSY